MARDTKQGLESNVILEATLNVDSVSQDIQPFDTAAPHIANNGIIKDGGISEIYETATTQSNATICYVTSTGKVLKLYQHIPVGAAGSLDIYVGTAVSGGIDRYIGEGSPLYFTRSAVALDYLDVAIASDNVHGLGLWNDRNGMHLDEFLLTTQAVTQTVTLSNLSTASDTVCLAAVIVRANTLTFASVQSTSGIAYVLGFSFSTSYWVNGSSYTIYTGSYFIPQSACDVFRAYYNGTSVVVVVPTGVAGGSLTYTAITPFAAWSEVTFSTHHIVQLGVTAALDPSATTLSLAAITDTDSVPMCFVNISAVGVVTTANPVNLTPSIASYTLQTGSIRTPWGSAGIFVDGSSHYGTASGTYDIYNSPNTSIPLQNPELVCQCLNAGSVNHGYNTFYLGVRTYGGVAAYLAVNDPLVGRPGFVSLNDFGGGTQDTDIMSGMWVTGSTTNTGNGMFWTPDFRNETVAGDGAWIVYRLANRSFVLATIWFNSHQQFTEISPGVVLINQCYSWNQIIDTNSYLGYENLSSHVFALHCNNDGTHTGNFYAAERNLYSSALSTNLLTGYDTTASVQIQPINYRSGTVASIYDGASGAYVYSLDVYQAANSIQYQQSYYAGTFVASTYVAPAADAVFQGSCIKMLSASAVQQPNYLGYQIANLFAVRYQAFFVLRGTWYTFDGTTIYRIPLSNGPASSVSGPNLPVASAAGLQYLTVSQDVAYFLSTFDNSIWIFDGGQTVTKQVALNQESAVQAGYYNTHDNSLTLVTSTNILTFRDESYFVSNSLPWTPYTAFNTYSTLNGIYFVNGTGIKIRTYTNLVPGTSTIIPLNWQSAYFGIGVQQSASFSSSGSTTDAGIGKGLGYAVAYIRGRIYWGSGTASQLTLTWYYISPDGTTSSSVSQTITPPANSAGYSYFQWSPPNSAVQAGSIGIVSADTTQKKTLLDVLVYYLPTAEVIATGTSAV